jgi:tRNA threonylcarbamoyladenosine biosynthesis protein TsaB
MRILAIDTATLTASCAVVEIDGGGALRVLAVRDGETSTHSEKILPLVASVAEEAGVDVGLPGAIDAFAVGAGPGSFTGLRIGMATAKGLAFAAGRPLWVVSSLAALALDLVERGAAALYLPLLDARRGEIYAGFYRAAHGVVEAIAPERVLPPEDLPAALAAMAAASAIAGGDALAIHRDPLAALPGWVTLDAAARTTPSAVAVARLALAGDRRDVLGHATPAYIRPSEAEVKYPDGVPGALRKH